MDETIWTAYVRQAVTTGDQDALRALFAQAVGAWGHDDASARWFALMGESDAGAQTG